MASSFAPSSRFATPLLPSASLAPPRTTRRETPFAVPRRLRARPAPAAAGAVRGDRTALGIAAIVGSTLSFPVSDLAAQSLMSALPPIEVAWLRYVVFLVVSLPLLLRGRAALRSARPAFQILRGAMSALATLAALVAFKFMAVPETTAIGFIAPVFVTGLAMVILREQVGLRRWVAAGVALAGVLVIVQPGAGSFRPIALLPLAGAVASALAVVATRLVRQDDPRTTVLYATTVGTLILTLAMLPGFVMPSMAQLEVVLVVGVFGALGMILQVVGYRLGPASALAPFSYMQLVFASGFAFLLTGAAPRVATLVGAAIIAGSAIYTAYRERVRGVA